MHSKAVRFEILYQDPQFVAIHKPSGFYVHPPENGRPIPRSQICLPHLRNQLGQYVYPVHRIDVATSGIVLWALSSEGASVLGRALREKRVRKLYHAVVRGHVPEKFQVNLPLLSDSSQDWLESMTEFRLLQKIELPFAVGKKFPTARYSLVEARPLTGRFHQIRRHLNRVSFPILGDGDHGDSHHNRFFREKLGISGLCLRASEIEFENPFEQGHSLRIRTRDDEKWKKIWELFSYSPELELRENT